MATPTPSAKQTPAQPAASSPPQSASKPRSPVNHMKRSRADTLKTMEPTLSQQSATPRSSTLQGSSPGFLGTPSQSNGGPGLGVSFATPGDGALGGTSMLRGGSTLFGLSSFGLDASLLRSDREASTMAKIAEIRQILAQRWGQVSRVGVRRCAARLGLECLWETGENEEVGVLDVAGDGVLLQITFKDHSVQDVHLSFPGAESNGKSKEQDDEQRGSAILLKDLQGWQREQHRGFYVDLDKFGPNLQYLSEVDHLGKSGINCFEAIDNLYQSLKLADDWWRKRRPGQDDLEILNKGMGWPRLHANGRLGARLDYWLYRWQVKRRGGPNEQLQDPTFRETDLFGLCIGVAPLQIASGSFTTPLRNASASAWFEFLDDMAVDESSDTADSLPPLQLQRKEPDPTYAPTIEDGQDEGISDSIPRPLPNAMFKASFDPPLAVSYAAASTLFGQPTAVALPYASLVFPQGTVDLQTPDQPIEITRDILHPPSGKDQSIQFALTGSKSLPAFLLREIPFSHPMDLITILSTLRQWAWLYNVVTKSLGRPLEILSSASDERSNRTKKKKSKRELSAKEVRAIIKAGGTWAPLSDTDDSDAEEITTLSPGNKASSDAAIVEGQGQIVSVSLELMPPLATAAALMNDGEADVSPIPMAEGAVSIRVVIPVGQDRDPVSVHFALLPGPRVVAVESSTTTAIAGRMARILEACEDMATLAQWVREQPPFSPPASRAAGTEATRSTPSKSDSGPGPGAASSNQDEPDAQMTDA